MLQLIRQSEFVEGRWRNGMGTSWDIVTERDEGAAEFSWRLAKARIDADVPFSIYRGMDRVFMQLEGNGLDLQFEGGRVIEVHESFVPHRFSCDIPLNCKLLDGPCMDLNLFFARDRFDVDASVVKLAGRQELTVAGPAAVFFALDGACKLSTGGATVALDEGDAAVLRHGATVQAEGSGAKLFVGFLNAI